MNDETAFLKAIQAAPADDAPRLVYADWLDEQGDPRARFVRDEVRAAGLFRNGKPAAARKLRKAAEKVGLEWALSVARPPAGVCTPIVFSKSRKPVTGERLDKAAKASGISLPPDYRAFLLLHNGGQTTTNEFDFDGSGIDGPEILGEFLPFKPEEGFRTVLEAYERQMGDFADLEDLFGSLLEIGLPAAEQDCIALSVAPDRFGAVFYQPYVEELRTPTKIADTLSEFLALLREPTPDWVWNIRDGDVARIRQWLEAGGDPMAQDANGYTPLELAIVHGRTSVARAILDHNLRLGKGYLVRLRGLARHYERDRISQAIEEFLKGQ